MYWCLGRWIPSDEQLKANRDEVRRELADLFLDLNDVHQHGPAGLTVITHVCRELPFHFKPTGGYAPIVQLLEKQPPGFPRV